MNLTISRDELLKPLNLVSGAIERRHTVAILSNVLLEMQDGVLRLTGTDMEVELVATVENVEASGNFCVTVPARKLLDIVKSLPADIPIELSARDEGAVIQCGKSKFVLSTLPADQYPNLEVLNSDLDIVVTRNELRSLIDGTHFSMANQDVRYYLNGMSIEIEGSTIRTVATDGHRLALGVDQLPQDTGQQRQIIVPRKGIMEILRLLDADDTQVTISITSNHIRISDPASGFIFTCKLVDGRFPDYRRVIPRAGDKVVIAKRDQLKDSFVRASILSNEKFRGVRLNVTSGELQITASNPEQEQAEEFLSVDYQGDALEIGFNVGYLLDVLNALKDDDVRILLTDGNSSGLIEGVSESGPSFQYVVMPMRI